MGKEINMKKDRRTKLFLMGSGITFLLFALTIRLFYLMVIDSKHLKSIALEQQISKIPIPAKRGKIVDRNGREVAINSDVYRVDIDLNMLYKILKTKQTLTLSSVEQAVASALNMDINTIEKKFNTKDNSGNPSAFVNLTTQVEKAQADAIKSLTVNGVKLNCLIVSSSAKRFYPDNSLFAQVIGHLNASGEGITGAEATYNTELSGVQGYKIVETDKNDNDLPYTEKQVTEPVNGKDMVLTLDERIQQVASATADKAMQDTKAKSVSITVMDPHTGEILAMVNKPDYDPNNPNKGTDSEAIQESWKNRAVGNVFEPGSIFKVMTSAAGLQEVQGAANLTFNSTGGIKVANRMLYNDKHEVNGILDMAGIMKHSDNVGFILLGQKIGKEKFVEFTSNIGFGKKTGIDLPGESSGIMRPLDKIGPVELATMSYGQGIAVTQIQYLSAFNAVANGGTWIRPHVMKSLITTDRNNNKTTEDFSKFDKKEVLTKANTDLIKSYLGKVVTEGTAVAAKMDDIPMAGKTGTARKVNTEHGGYIDGAYVSSFVGMAPIDNPVVTFIVTVDEPDSDHYYASETAVPATKNLLTQLASYMPIQTQLVTPAPTQKNKK